MCEFGQPYGPPGYYDLHPHNTSSPPPAFGNGMPGAYNSWGNGAMTNAMSGGMGGSMSGMPLRAFSPVQQGTQGYGGWFQGYGWSGMR